MKFNFNSNHIRLYKLLQIYNLNDIQFMCELLKLSEKTIILYIKQLYHFIPNKINRTNITKDMITDISSSKELLPIIKTLQAFTRDERILYITLKLLIRKKIILTNLCIFFQVSRRTLNNDLQFIKDRLNIFNLSLTSDPGKGIFLTGDETNIKRALCIYLYKFLIEANELPFILKKEYIKTINLVDLATIEKDSKVFLEKFNLDIFFHNKTLLQAFLLSFSMDKNTENSLKSMSFSLFSEASQDFFQKENINSIKNFIDNSSLGNTKIYDLKYFFNILNICKGNFIKTSENLKTEIEYIQNLFFNELNMIVIHDDFLENLISRLIFVKNQKHYLDIFEMFFLKLTLGESINNSCIKIFLELRKKYPRISFSDVISLYLWISSQSSFEKKEKAVLLYENLPKQLLPIMKDKLYNNHKIIVVDFITPNKLDNFLIENIVDKVITFEPIKVRSKQKKIIHLPILD